MTNGEKIMQVFPDLQIDMGELEVYMWTTTHDAIDIPLDWWNAEYKEPNHIADADKMIEPTAKTCRTCRNFGSHHGICDICKKYSCWTEKEPTTDNDSAVDCIVDVLGSYTDLDIPYKREIAENILTKLPSVTPQEPKTGHWIPRNSFLLQYKCSECGFKSEKYNYCPNCGSRNEVEE